jgi:hypothetical protein
VLLRKWIRYSPKVFLAFPPSISIGVDNDIWSIDSIVHLSNSLSHSCFTCSWKKESKSEAFLVFFGVNSAAFISLSYEAKNLSTSLSPARIRLSISRDNLQIFRAWSS